MGSDKDIKDLSGGICDTPEVSPMLGGWIMRLLMGIKLNIDYLLCETELYK
jgi:hypothetical protein